jgi:hypothetical protein
MDEFGLAPVAFDGFLRCAGALPACSFPDVRSHAQRLIQNFSSVWRSFPLRLHVELEQLYRRFRSQSNEKIMNRLITHTSEGAFKRTAMTPERACQRDHGHVPEIGEDEVCRSSNQAFVLCLRAAGCG